MIAQKQGPLAGVRNLRCLAQNLRDGVAVGLAQRHEDTGHQRKVIGHMTFVTVTKIRQHVCRPLVRLGQKHTRLVVLVEQATYFFEHRVRLGQVLVDGPLAFAQVGHRVQAEAIHAHVQPEAHGPKHGAQDLRVGVIEIGLVREKTVPIVRPSHRVPGPVRLFRVQKDNPRPGILRIRMAPDIVVPFARVWSGAPCRLKPGVLVGGMIHHQFSDDL